MYTEDELKEAFEVGLKEVAEIEKLARKADFERPQRLGKQTLNNIGQWLRRERARYNFKAAKEGRETHTWEHKYSSQKVRRLIYMRLEDLEL